MSASRTFLVNEDQINTLINILLEIPAKHSLNGIDIMRYIINNQNHVCPSQSESAEVNKEIIVNADSV